MSDAEIFDPIVYSPVNGQPTDFSDLHFELSQEAISHDDLYISDDDVPSSQSTCDSVCNITDYSDAYISNISFGNDRVLTGDYSISDLDEFFETPVDFGEFETETFNYNLDLTGVFDSNEHSQN